MFALGTAITDPELYERAAGRGYRLAAEPDSIMLANAAAGSIYRSYNLILDQAAQIEGLEGLVLVHQDAEIADASFLPTARAALRDPEVAVVGCVGAVGVRSIAWWEGSVTWASFIHRYGELGGGDLPGFAWAAEGRPAYARTGQVDSVDGFVLVLSPWAVREVRFDEDLGALHGYDLDYCLQVRERGRKVVTADLKVIHHHSLTLISNPDTWIDAHKAVAEKWDGRMPGIGHDGAGDWKRRARQAEAEAAVARAAARAEQYKAEAMAAQLQRDFEETISSISWRVTRPLREVNSRRRLLAERRRRGVGPTGTVPPGPVR